MKSKFNISYKVKLRNLVTSGGPEGPSSRPTADARKRGAVGPSNFLVLLKLMFFSPEIGGRINVCKLSFETMHQYIFV